MHNQPYVNVGCIALCTRKKLLKSGAIRDFYGNSNCSKLKLKRTNGNTPDYLLDLVVCSLLT